MYVVESLHKKSMKDWTLKQLQHSRDLDSRTWFLEESKFEEEDGTGTAFIYLSKLVRLKFSHFV